MANKSQKKDTREGYLHPEGTFLQMDHVETSLGHKGVKLGEYIHKHRRG